MDLEFKKNIYVHKISNCFLQKKLGYATQKKSILTQHINRSPNHEYICNFVD
jgi:hypothetical protein